MPEATDTRAVPAFIRRWEQSGAAERANYQLFLSELCELLEVPRPDPAVADDSQNAYVFERAVTFRNPDGSCSPGWIDLYKRGCFVLEAKQGSADQPAQPSLLPHVRHRRGVGVRGTEGWDEAMIRARFQAEQYAKALPVSEGWPPFLVIVDVGYSIELYSDFSGTGKAYVPFPEAGTHRIAIHHLEHASVRELLRAVWIDPTSLDPARISARVTRDVAAQLAELARDLERQYEPHRVASFLMRCIFTSFAEDVHLLPEGGWTRLLESLRADTAKFVPMVESLWRTMNDGGFSPIVREHVLRFNGGLFESVEALPVTERQLDLLIRAGSAQWQDVEPAIFGTLLERALDPAERHRLGAHFTPRAYVERLVLPTVIEPLREDWKAVQTAAVALARAGKSDRALDEVQAFRRKLCSVRVLDPACGSGNFLYVSLEHLKRLEGEVLDMLAGLGDRQQALAETGLTVDPHQLLGIELNPRAAVITDLVLWIGYLQWFFRTWGAQSVPPEPVIKRFHNIETRDAVLAYDSVRPALDENGQARTQWDGRTMRPHPVTGQDVPDETARRPVLEYENPHEPEWPKAEFVVGNPPFVGNKYMRFELGDGYADALRTVYADVPDTADYVMYWWHRAAKLARASRIRRFGFIATNSLRQTFNRRVLAAHMSADDPLSLVYAIPDHPWVDSADGAAVRISMTVAEAGQRGGVLSQVISETSAGQEGSTVGLEAREGRINPDLTVGADVSATVSLRANEGLSCPGVKLHGSGFIVTPQQAGELGLGGLPGLERHIRHYRNGRDITSRPRNVMVIDLFGLNADEVRARFPEVFQWVWDRVKPERDHNNRLSYRQNWWIHGEPRADFRPALEGLARYIATPVTAKHRFFVFLDGGILPDDALIAVASSDPSVLGVLSSRIHVCWALAAGGTLEDRPRYNKTRCFEPFPFPACSERHRARIRELGERLDRHRARQQELYPDLTLTDMYNVLERLRAREPLNDRERRTHEHGLVSVLLDIHDDLDRAVAEAYGWPPELATEDILFRLVALNAERAAEERNGLIHWLRPEFQSPSAKTQAGLEITVEAGPAPAARTGRSPWPESLPDRVRAVREALAALPGPADAETIARGFTRARVADVREILSTLVYLGQARQTDDKFIC